MRLFMTFAVFVALTALSGPVRAADEFGARFTAETTAALQDNEKTPEEALSEIAPAAGDEDNTTPAKQDDKPQNADMDKQTGDEPPQQ